MEETKPDRRLEEISTQVDKAFEQLYFDMNENEAKTHMILSRKVAFVLDQLLSNENLRLDLNTSRELFSLTGGGVRHNGEYVPVQAIKIDEALKAITISEQEKCI